MQGVTQAPVKGKMTLPATHFKQITLFYKTLNVQEPTCVLSQDKAVGQEVQTLEESKYFPAVQDA